MLFESAISKENSVISVEEWALVFKLFTTASRNVKVKATTGVELFCLYIFRFTKVRVSFCCGVLFCFNLFWLFVVVVVVGWLFSWLVIGLGVCLFVCLLLLLFFILFCFVMFCSCCWVGFLCSLFCRGVQTRMTYLKIP